MIGGQALIEGIMMRGPKQDAIVVRGKDGLTVDVSDRKIHKPGSFPTWPLIRGAVNFFDAQVVGVKVLHLGITEYKPAETLLIHRLRFSCFFEFFMRPSVPRQPLA